MSVSGEIYKLSNICGQIDHYAKDGGPGEA